MEMALDKMYGRTLSSLCLLFSAIPGVSRAESGLWCTGTFTFLVFHDRIFEANAAFQSFKQLFPRSKRQEDQAQDEELPLCCSTPQTISPEVKAAVKLLKTHYKDHSVYNFSLTTVQRAAESTARRGNAEGEESVRNILSWRVPAPQKDSALDEVLRVEETANFRSSVDGFKMSLKRVSRVDGSASLWHVDVRDAGYMTVRPIVLPGPDVLAPEKAKRFVEQFDFTLQVPRPLGLSSPLHLQETFGLLTPVDILRLKAKYVVPQVSIPHHTVLNLFVLYPPVECGMQTLLQHMKENIRDYHKKDTVRQGQASLSVQVLGITGKLRKAGLVPPPLTSASFVVDAGGKVFLAKFTPLLQEGNTYVRRADGSTVQQKETKSKTGFARLEEVEESEEIFCANGNRTDRDVARLLYDIWCLSRSGNTDSDLEHTGSPARLGEPSSTLSEQRKGAAGPRAPEDWPGSIIEEEGPETSISPLLDWSACDDVLEEVQDISRELWSSNGTTLANITEQRAFRNLQRLARGRTTA